MHKVDVSGRQKKFHINMLKKYVRRDHHDSSSRAAVEIVATIMEDDEDEGVALVDFSVDRKGETSREISLGQDLTPSEREM